MRFDTTHAVGRLPVTGIVRLVVPDALETAPSASGTVPRGARGMALCGALLVFLFAPACLVDADVADVVSRHAFEERAARPGAGGTCYGDQLAGDPDALRDATSSVWILALDSGERSADGIQCNGTGGTGFVVARSAAPGGHARMLTAGHVVDSARRAGHALVVYDSHARMLGSAHEVVADSAGAPRPDVAVLEMDAGADLRLYDAIPGLPLAPLQTDGLVELADSRPGNLAEGASGSPVTDATGHVVGVAVRRTDSGSAFSVALRASSMIHYMEDARTRPATLPLGRDMVELRHVDDARRDGPSQAGLRQ